ncbi:MAG: flagellar hook basal-body protein [Bryobacterales bacterium]
MPSPFFTGLSGLRAHSRAVEVVANNLANLNTIGFKGSRSDFRDLFYQQIGQSRSGVASQVGIGAAPVTVFRRFEQGTVQNTGGLLDAAIQGEGFFIVEDGDLTLYTRAGNFQLNHDQELVTVNGEMVQGWVRDRTTER